MAIFTFPQKKGVTVAPWPLYKQQLAGNKSVNLAGYFFLGGALTACLSKLFGFGLNLSTSLSHCFGFPLLAVD